MSLCRRAVVVVRPPDIVVGGLIFYQGFFLSSFFFRRSLNGTQPYPATWSEVNVTWKRIVQYLAYSLPLQTGGPKTTFWTTSQLNGKFNAYIIGMKNGIHKRASALKTTGGLLHRSKRHELWSANGFKLEVSFHPPYSAFHFIARLRRRRSANATQPHFVKRWTVGRANNVL